MDTTEPKLRSNNRVWMWVGVVVIIALIAVAVIGWYKLANPTTKESATSTSTATPVASVQKDVWVAGTSSVLTSTTSSDTHKLADNSYRMYYMSNGQMVYAESDSTFAFGASKSTGITEDAGKFMSNPSVLKITDSNWIMIYEQQPIKQPGSNNQNNPPGPTNQRNLYLATSTDGQTFSKAGLVLDSSILDNYFASVPDMILLPNNQIRMYYVSGGNAIGSVLSSDNGKTWVRDSGYRLEDSAVDPDVIVGGTAKWVMYYSKLNPSDNAIYKATSKDGLTWVQQEKVLDKKSASGVIVDPDVVPINDNSYVMFYGESGATEQIDLYMAKANHSIFR
ncbi:MAG: hypothetical protein WC773_02960 [Patescibacteria group bacterium]|jgi:hypothetical protein